MNHGADERARRRGPLHRGLQRGGHACLVLFRVMVPTYIVMELFKRFGVIAAVGAACGPLMKWLQLPGEAAVPLLLGLLVNVAAAAAALGSLGLPGDQVTTLGVMIAMAHALPVETLVLRAVGARAWRLLLYRLVMAGLAGLVCSRLFITGAP
jgi:hypothetical protein